MLTLRTKKAVNYRLTRQNRTKTIKSNVDDTNKVLIAHGLLDEDAVQAITEIPVQAITEIPVQDEDEDNFHLELESDSDEQTKEEKGHSSKLSD